MGNERQFIATGAKPRGEASVWLCGMGLAIGLVMVGVLLAVIFYRGFEVFWPRRIVEFKLKNGKSVAGEVVLYRDKAGSRECQLFTANKDLTGASFRYVAEADIARRGMPADTIKIERTEFGYAIGRPVRFRLADGTQVEAADPRFDETLRTQVAAAARQRREIFKIDKTKVGAISTRMTRLRRHLRALERSRQGDSPETVECRRELAELQTRADTLAHETSGMREALKKPRLTIRIDDGRELEIAAGNIIRYTRPNRLSTAGRIGKAMAGAWYFVSENPREANMEGGVFPAIFGTLMMTILMSLLVTPFGVVAAVYMHEYARQGVLLRLIRIAVNNLAGVPSIVFGVFGLGFFVYFLGGNIDKLFFPEYLPENSVFGSGGMLWASLTLALLTLPVVIVASEEALSAVPRGMREASYAVGASKWQTIHRIVIPAAVPGIITGMILAMARGAGEVAPLMLVGVVKTAPDLPLSAGFPFGLDRKFMHLGFNIFDLGLHSPDSEAARPMVFATTVLLILLVVVMNLAGIVIRERLRRKYAAGAF